MEKEEARKAKETKQEKKTMTGKKYIAAALFASVLTVLMPASGIFEIFEGGAPSGCATVSAAEKESGGRTGEITVYMHGSTEYVKDIPLSGEEVAVYRAAYLKTGYGLQQSCSRIPVSAWRTRRQSLWSAVQTFSADM